MDWKELVHRLELDDHAVLDQKVNAVAEFKIKSLVANWLGFLPFHREPAPGKLMGQASFIGAF
jgi:hypothetical protein